MGVFDIFNSNDQQKAASDQTSALNQGFNQYSGFAGQGRDAINANYADALKPFQQNYDATSGGATNYAALLGVPGAGGSGGGATPNLQDLLAKIPGYQFVLDQGSQNVMRNAAATGTTASGGTLDALQKQGQGQASQNYFNYLQALQPLINASGNAATGIAGVKTGQGNALNQSFGNQGGAALGTAAGIGNAQAQADLAPLTASGNFWGALTGAAKSGLQTAAMV